MQKPFFSIVVVSLNPGDRLEKTLNSIWKQTFKNYEVILKDGGSTDGSLEQLLKQGYFEDKKEFVIESKKDKSIYDGMNQALSLIKGKYVQFLNCGDYFYSDRVLEEVAGFIESQDTDNVRSLSGEFPNKKGIDKNDVTVSGGPKIFYGNQYNQQQDTIVYSAPEINDFTCYRNVPCHQVCFYDSRLFKKRAYDLKYKVRADYEHFLYSIYEEKAKGVSMLLVVASYEGGGFSETKENRRKSSAEHKEITTKYLGQTKVLKYRIIMWLTLAPLRTFMAESPVLSGLYNGMKNGVYKLLRKGK